MWDQADRWVHRRQQHCPLSGVVPLSSELETCMPITARRLAVACAAGTLTLGLAACGGSTTTPGGSAPPPVSVPASSGPTTSADDADDAESPTAPAGAKVSANTASEEEIAAALESAGVSNADRWAEEVVEYRPYPTDDPNLTKLRENLAKYNPGEQTINQIVATLTP